MSSLPANLKWIRPIATEKKWRHRFFGRSRAAISLISGGIWPKFELSQILIYVLVTYKYKKNQIKKTAENRSLHYKSMGIFSDAKGQLTP